MSKLKVYTSTPIYHLNTENSLCPPILFNNLMYIINFNILSSVLKEICLYEDYISFVDIKGYVCTKQWLLKKGLLNLNFLKAISYYKLTVQSENNFMYNLLGNNYSDFLSDYIQNYYQLAYLNEKIKQNKEIFNKILSEYLENAILKIASYNDDTAILFEKEVIARYIYKDVIQQFIQICNDDELTQTVNIKANQNVCIKDIEVFDVFNSAVDKKNKKRFKSECLKQGINLSFDLEKNNRVDESDIVYFSSLFTQDIFDYILKKQDYIDIKMNNHNVEQITEKNSSSIALKLKLNTLHESIKQLKKTTNLFIAPKDDLSKIITFLNMNDENSTKIKDKFMYTNNITKDNLLSFISSKGKGLDGVSNFVKMQVI